MQVGYGPEGLLPNIVSDIQAQDGGLYPPFIQMVAQTLAEAAKSQNSIATKDLYDSLGGARGIIANYLIQRLDDFGSRRYEAEKVLKVLVRSSGRRREDSLDGLTRATGLELKSLRPLLLEMTDRRMVRSLGDDRFVVIHDYFAQLIDRGLVSDDERQVKRLKELLAVRSFTNQSMRSPLSVGEVAQLYIYRAKISPAGLEQMLLFETWLAEFGNASSVIMLCAML